jgi:hypothetical protein
MLAWFRYGYVPILPPRKGLPAKHQHTQLPPPGSDLVPCRGPDGTLLLLVYSESTVLVLCYASTANVLYTKEPYLSPLHPSRYGLLPPHPSSPTQIQLATYRP